MEILPNFALTLSAHRRTGRVCFFFRDSRPDISPSMHRETNSYPFTGPDCYSRLVPVARQRSPSDPAFDVAANDVGDSCRNRGLAVIGLQTLKQRVVRTFATGGDPRIGIRRDEDLELTSPGWVRSHTKCQAPSGIRGRLEAIHVREPLPVSAIFSMTAAQK